jgi:6-phospho-3-hexuloisomerase
MDRHIKVIINEINLALSAVDEKLAENLTAEVLAAKSIYTFGWGRSGLIAKAFAMRLMHLGLLSHAVGEPTAPAIQNGDLLIVCSKSGKTETTCVIAEAAKKKLAKVWSISAVPNSKLSNISDLNLTLPINFESVQYGGSLFEQSLLIFFDSLTLRLQQKLKVRTEDMDQRHSNLQ